MPNGVAGRRKSEVGRVSRHTSFILLFSRPCHFASLPPSNRYFLRLVHHRPHARGSLRVGTSPTLLQPIGHVGDSGFTASVPAFRFSSDRIVLRDTTERKRHCYLRSGIGPPENHSAVPSASSYRQPPPGML